MPILFFPAEKSGQIGRLLFKIIINKSKEFVRRTAIITADNDDGEFSSRVRGLATCEECKFLVLPESVAARVRCMDADLFMLAFMENSRVTRKSPRFKWFKTDYRPRDPQAYQ